MFCTIWHGELPGATVWRRADLVSASQRYQERGGFAGETRVVTLDGLAPFRELAGSVTSTLDKRANGHALSSTLDNRCGFGKIVLERIRCLTRFVGVQTKSGRSPPLPARFNNRQPLPFRTASLTEIAGSPRWKLVTVNPT